MAVKATDRPEARAASMFSNIFGFLTFDDNKHFFSWCKEIELGVKRLHLFLDHFGVAAFMPPPQIYDRLVKLLPKEHQSLLEIHDPSLKTPQAFLQRVKDAFPERGTQLTIAVAEIIQGSECTYVDRFKANVTLYNEHKMRKKLDASLYKLYFGNTHRPPITGVAGPAMVKFQSAQARAEAAGKDPEDLEIIRLACLALDTAEDVQRSDATRMARHDRAENSVRAQVAALQRDNDRLRAQMGTGRQYHGHDGGAPPPEVRPWRSESARREQPFGGRGRGRGRGRGDRRTVTFARTHEEFDDGTNGEPTLPSTTAGAIRVNVPCPRLASACVAPAPITFHVHEPRLAAVTRAGSNAQSPRASTSPPRTGPPVAETADADVSATRHESDAVAASADEPPGHSDEAQGATTRLPARRRRQRGPRRRAVARKDLGDTCQEEDSDALIRRREALERLRSSPEWQAEVPQRVATALFKSTVVMSLSDIVAMLRNEALADTLLRLARVLANKGVSAAQAQADTQMAAALVEMARDAGEHAAIVAASVARGLREQVMPPTPEALWADVNAAAQRIEELPGAPEERTLTTASMRSVAVSLSSEPGAPVHRAVIDEGAELSLMRIATLKRSKDFWQTGHPPLAEQDPPELFQLSTAIAVKAFQGTSAACGTIARVHIRIGHAVYPEWVLLVNDAPADLVLGLTFRTKYGRPAPKQLERQRTRFWDVSKLFLGVPRGCALQVPGYWRKHPSCAGKSPAECVFVQMVHLDTVWRPWQVAGKPLSGEAISCRLGLPGNDRA